jgi:hypothetical protein
MGMATRPSRVQRLKLRARLALRMEAAARDAGSGAEAEEDASGEDEEAFKEEGEGGTFGQSAERGKRKRARAGMGAE